MIADAYTSTNLALEALWVAVSGLAPETMVVRLPVGDTAPVPGLLVDWLERGTPTAWAGTTKAVVQLQLLVGGGDEVQANAWAEGLAAGLGLIDGGGRFGVGDYDQDPAPAIGEAHVAVKETGWVVVSDPDPDVVRLSLTLVLTFVPLAG